MTEPFSGRSRGFAFVEMRRDQDAEKAIRELHGMEIEGRAIVVNEARPREPHGTRGSSRRGSWR
jgi:RNA recognition motif-containing protein